MTGRDTFDLFSDRERGRFGDNEQSPSPSLRADSEESSAKYTLIEHYDRGNAVKVSEDGIDSNHFWLPKSKIEIRRTTKQAQITLPDGQKTHGAVIEITIPNWLAKEKGLI